MPKRQFSYLLALVLSFSIGAFVLASPSISISRKGLNPIAEYIGFGVDLESPHSPDPVSPAADDLVPQSDQTWSGGSTGNNTAWYTTTNWVGGAFPGSSSGVTTNTDIATLPTTGTSTPNATIGINLSTPTGNIHYLGALNFTGTVNRAIGDSSSASGSLQLNGSTINGNGNVIIRHLGTALFTIQNNGGNSGAMNISLGNTTDNIINIDSTGSLNISSAITGAGKRLTLGGSGTGVLTLSGLNTFTGPLVISGTTLSVPTINNGAVAGTLGQSSNAASNLVFDGGTLRYSANNDGSTNRNFTVNNGKTAVIDIPTAGVNLTMSGASTATNGALTKTGGGSLMLTGANLYSGNTTINGGYLILSFAGSIANSPQIEIAGGSFFDVGTLTSPLTMSPGQSLKVSGTTSAATISTQPGKGLTTATDTTIQFAAYNGVNAPLTIQGSGSVTLSGTNSVVVNTTTTLSPGDYTLIAKGSAGSVTGTAPTNLTFGGSGIAPGTVATLQITGAQLVLHVAVDTTPFNVTSVSPTDGATNVAQSTNMVVTFNRPANATTITTNTADTNCSGSLQVSSDNFATCVRMSSSPVANATNTAFTVMSTMALSTATTYRVRVTTAAHDTNGTALVSTYTQPAGFTTEATSTVNFSSAIYQVAEGTPQVAITLVRGGDTSTAFTVDLNTSNGSATLGTCGSPGADYEAVSTTVSFAAGDVTKVVNVPICTDLLSESPAESFAVTLSNVSTGTTMGSVSSASVTIIDAATEFTNTSFLEAGAGQTVSSDITVTGYQGNVSGMRVTLSGLSATTADDLDVLLMDPAGHKYALVGDVGGSGNLNNVTLTFEDTGSAGFVPDTGPIAEGQNYQPTNCLSPVTDFAGSPAGAIVEPGCGPTLTNTLAATFGGENPSGAWTVYLRNDGGAAFGTPVTSVSINGWGIQFLAPTAAPVSIGGRVVTAQGEGIRGAAVTISGGDLAQPTSVRADAAGNYIFQGLRPGMTYIVSVRAKNTVFADAVRVVTVLDNVAGVDFVAQPRE